MSDNEDSLSPIHFTYTYVGHGWAEAWISDGVTEYRMDPSYVPQNPLFVLIAAVDKVLTYGAEADCVWSYEPAEDRWLLQREGDRLHISIRGVRDGFSELNWSRARGEVRFTTTCDVWAFAHKVQLAVSRLKPEADDLRDPTRVKDSAEYRVLCALLDEYKQRQRTSSGKSDAL